jgi:hypothetical protein
VSPTPARHQQRVDLGDKFMRMFASTVPAAPDDFAHTRGREAEQPLSRGNVLAVGPGDAEGVAPFVPSGPNEHLLVGPVIEVGKGPMAGIDEHQPQLLDPHSKRTVKINAIGMRDWGVPRGEIEVIDLGSERAIDDLPLRRANVLQEQPMLMRKIQPGKLDKPSRVCKPPLVNRPASGAVIVPGHPREPTLMLR